MFRENDQFNKELEERAIVERLKHNVKNLNDWPAINDKLNELSQKAQLTEKDFDFAGQPIFLLLPRLLEQYPDIRKYIYRANNLLIKYAIQASLSSALIKKIEDFQGDLIKFNRFPISNGLNQQLEMQYKNAFVQLLTSISYFNHGIHSGTSEIEYKVPYRQALENLYFFLTDMREYTLFSELGYVHLATTSNIDHIKKISRACSGSDSQDKGLSPLQHELYTKDFRLGYLSITEDLCETVLAESSFHYSFNEKEVRVEYLPAIRQILQMKSDHKIKDEKAIKPLLKFIINQQDPIVQYDLARLFMSSVQDKDEYQAFVNAYHSLESPDLNWLQFPEEFTDLNTENKTDVIALQLLKRMKSHPAQIEQLIKYFDPVFPTKDYGILNSFLDFMDSEHFKTLNESPKEKYRELVHQHFGILKVTSFETLNKLLRLGFNLFDLNANQVNIKDDSYLLQTIQFFKDNKETLSAQLQDKNTHDVRDTFLASLKFLPGWAQEKLEINEIDADWYYWPSDEIDLTCDHPSLNFAGDNLTFDINSITEDGSYAKLCMIADQVLDSKSYIYYDPDALLYLLSAKYHTLNAGKLTALSTNWSDYIKDQKDQAAKPIPFVDAKEHLSRHFFGKTLNHFAVEVLKQKPELVSMVINALNSENRDLSHLLNDDYFYKVAQPFLGAGNIISAIKSKGQIKASNLPYIKNIRKQLGAFEVVDWPLERDRKSTFNQRIQILIDLLKAEGPQDTNWNLYGVLGNSPSQVMYILKNANESKLAELTTAAQGQKLYLFNEEFDYYHLNDLSVPVKHMLFRFTNPEKLNRLIDFFHFRKKELDVDFLTDDGLLNWINSRRFLNYPKFEDETWLLKNPAKNSKIVDRIASRLNNAQLLHGVLFSNLSQDQKLEKLQARIWNELSKKETIYKKELVELRNLKPKPELLESILEGCSWNMNFGQSKDFFPESISSVDDSNFSKALVKSYITNGLRKDIESYNISNMANIPVKMIDSEMMLNVLDTLIDCTNLIDRPTELSIHNYGHCIGRALFWWFKLAFQNNWINEDKAAQLLNNLLKNTKGKSLIDFLPSSISNIKLETHHILLILSLGVSIKAVFESLQMDLSQMVDDDKNAGLITGLLNLKCASLVKYFQEEEKWDALGYLISNKANYQENIQQALSRSIANILIERNDRELIERFKFHLCTDDQSRVISVFNSQTSVRFFGYAPIVEIDLAHVGLPQLEPSAPPMTEEGSETMFTVKVEPSAPLMPEEGSENPPPLATAEVVTLVNAELMGATGVDSLSTILRMPQVPTHTIELPSSPERRLEEGERERSPVANYG